MAQTPPPCPPIPAALSHGSAAGCAVGYGGSPAGMCHDTAASPTGPRASLAALRESRYEDEMQCLEKSSPKLAKGSRRRCLPRARHGTSAHATAQRDRPCARSEAAPKTIPALPAPPFASQRGRSCREKKFAPQAGRPAHTPCFAKCIRSIPATNRLAGALSGTREGRAM